MTNLSILKALVLKLENELTLYEDTYRNLFHKAKEIQDKYQIGIKIDAFLYGISKIKDSTEILNKCEEFKNEKVNDGKSIGDYFDLDADSIASGKIKYSIKVTKDLEYCLPEKANSKQFQIGQAIFTSGEKVIVSSIQYFEEFFACLLRELIISKPEAYFYDKKIEYKELVGTDIDKIKERIVDEEVNTLMYGVKETIERINKIHKLNLEKHNDLWQKYIEIDMHRNIITHNAGAVNNEYNTAVCDKFKKAVGEYIRCDKKLIEMDISSIIKFAFLLCYLVWDDKRDFQVLEDVAFEFLCKEKWELSEFCYDLLRKIPAIENETKINCQINYLNAIKHINGLEKTRKEIEELDVSGMEKMFFVAKQLLLENNQLVLDSIDETYPDEFTTYTILYWPIFIEFRKTNEFKEFISRHSDDFEEYEFDIKERKHNLETDSSQL